MITGTHIHPIWCRFKILSLVLLFLVLQKSDLHARQDTLKSNIIFTGLENPTSLYVTKTNIYIVDRDKNQLVLLDLKGKETERIGGNGSGEYQFSQPVDVDATNGLKIYVSDYNNRRIQVFDRRGQYLSSFEAGTGSRLMERNRRFTPTQLVVNNMGEVFFYNESEKSIERYDFNGTLADSYQLPREIAKLDDIEFDDQSFYVLDSGKEVIHELSENWMPLTFYPAEGVQAFTVTNGEIWLIKEGQILRESANSEKAYHLSTSDEAVDAFITDLFLYILYPNALHQIELPE